jgi:hypothetical protein
MQFSSVFIVLFLLYTMPGYGQLVGGKAWEKLSFPIISWFGPSSELITDTIFQDMVDAGFTANLSFSLSKTRPVPTREANIKMLDHARNVGLTLLIVDERIDIHSPFNSNTIEKLNSVISDYKDHPAFLGYFLCDEGGLDTFDNLSKIKNYICEKDSNHLVYINLFPNYADCEKQLHATSYKEYVSGYLSKVHPQVLSFDNYGILAGKLRSNYFENLEIIRKNSLSNKIPFWAFTLSTPHYSYAMPTVNTIRFQLFCALAYGAKGIQYFTYGVPPELSTVAPIDIKGNRTSIWYMTQSVNREILKLAPTLKLLQNIDVYHSNLLLRGTHRIPEDFYVTSIDTKPMVVGFFLKNKTIPYIMLVNRDFNNKISTVATFARSVKSIVEISKITGRELPAITPDDRSAITLRFEAGEGRLFRIVTRK